MTHLIKLNLMTKGIDAADLPSTIRSKSVIETVRNYFKEKEPPISSKIFNFSSTLSGFYYHQFDNSPSQCECNTSSYLYQPYSHVITGALKVRFQVERSDYKYSPKYREPC